MIESPTLLVFEERVSANINSILARSNTSGVSLRPHFKTHQTMEVGDLFRGKVSGITVSSIEMANFFADQGWEDITIAFPINPRQMDDLEKLANRVSLNLLISDHEATGILQKANRSKIKWWIKVNVGNNRSGFRLNDLKGILSVVDTITETPDQGFEGLLGHAGQTYYARHPGEIEEKERSAISAMVDLAKKIRGQRKVEFKISLGDTPGCSVVNDWDGIDELRPGNFVFYDMMQLEIGSCSSGQIALAMACPIVEVNHKDNKAIIHGGAIHFSKEYSKKYHFGQVLIPKDELTLGDFMPNSYLESISQEHGIISFDPKYRSEFAIGKLAYIHPIHSCLTVDAMREYTLIPSQRIAKTYRSFK